MTKDEVIEMFYEDYPIEQLTERHCKALDANAIMILCRMFPDESKIIDTVDDGCIYFSPRLDDFCEIATENDVKNLKICGVLVDQCLFDSLVM